MNTLVIDDETDVRRVLSTMLARLGHDVREAGDGRRALDMLRDGPRPDLVLLDWRMPDMDGLATLKSIRSHPEWGPVRVMMVTGVNDWEEITSALDAGADEYLMKPVTARALRSKLESLGL